MPKPKASLFLNFLITKTHTAKDVVAKKAARSGQYGFVVGDRKCVYVEDGGRFVEQVDRTAVPIRDGVTTGDVKKVIAACLNGADLDRAFPRIDHGYVSRVSFEDELHVKRGDSNAEYNKDKFAEGEGGGDYINGEGEGSQSTRRGEVGRQEDDERAVLRAAEIQNLPARYIELGEPMDQRTAESVISGFPMLTNDYDGRKVRLPIKTVGKILRHKGFEFSRIINELPKLYQTSLFGWSEPEIPKEGHKAHSNVKEYHHYVNKFTDGDSEYYIRFTVNEEYTKPGASARNFIHSAAVSDIAVYKKGDHPRRGWVTFPGEAGPSPFVDRKLQEFFDNGEASQRIRVIDPGEASTSPSTDKILPAGEKVNKKIKIFQKPPAPLSPPTPRPPTPTSAPSRCRSLSKWSRTSSASAPPSSPRRRWAAPTASPSATRTATG